MISPWNHDQFWKTKTVSESTFPEDFGTPPRCSIWMIIQWDIQGLVTTKFSLQISVKDEAPVSSIWLHMKIQRPLSLLWWPHYNLILLDSPSFASYWFGKHFSLGPLAFGLYCIPATYEVVMFGLYPVCRVLSIEVVEYSLSCRVLTLVYFSKLVEYSL